MKPRILLIDDDPGQLALLTAILERESFVTTALTNPRKALEAVRSDLPDAVLCDLDMPGMTGIEVLHAIRSRHAALPVIVVTGKLREEDAEEAFHAGATDFVTKPVARADLVARLRRSLEEAPAQELLASAARKLFDGLVGHHPRIQDVRRFVERVASVPRVPALVLGESGTGKNLVARAIHAASHASRFRFVEVNCAALPGHLLEAELFGYEKGAFTDARESKKGLAEVADQGTLFLDEVGTLPLELQAKLLTFLESRRFRRLGSTRDVDVDLRIVAATNADLEEEVGKGRFREDLYYRLDVAQVVLPPLRQIRSDIPDLAAHFLERAASYFGKPVPRLHPDSVQGLVAYDWPGNARELRNVVERALIFSAEDPLRVAIPAVRTPGAVVQERDDVVVLPRGLTLEEVERRYMEETLQDTGGNVGEAAERLGLTRKVFWARRRKAGLLEGEGDGGSRARGGREPRPDQ